ncbi:ubiquitin-specific protease ubp1 [Sorochytrium milnesiophthora]
MSADSVFVQLSVTVTIVVLAANWLRVRYTRKRRDSYGAYEFPSDSEEEDAKSLAALPGLREYLYERAVQESNSPAPVTAALFETLEVLNTPLKTRKSMPPTLLLRSLAPRTRLINRDQQDAQELFQTVSSSLSAEEEKSKRQQPTSLLDALAAGREDLSPAQRAALRGPLPVQSNTSPLMGMLASRLSCVRCGYTAAIRHFTFDNMSLSLPLRSSCTLMDALATYMAIESISDANCRRCSVVATLASLRREHGAASSKLAELRASIKSIRSEIRELEKGRKHGESKGKLQKRRAKMVEHEHTAETITASLVIQEKRIARLAGMLEGSVEDELPPTFNLVRAETQHTKQLMIGKPPRILALHLNRSSIVGYNVVKNNCSVDYPELLDLTPFCTNGHLSVDPLAPISIVRDDNEDDLDTLVNGGDPAAVQVNGVPTEGKSKKQRARRRRKSHGGATTAATVDEQPVVNGSGKHPAHSAETVHHHPADPFAGKVMYRLQALVVHYGRHEYGHYIAYRRGPAPVSAQLAQQLLNLRATPPANARPDNVLCSYEAPVGVQHDLSAAEPSRALYDQLETELSRQAGWLRISDDQVSAVGEDEALGVGQGAYMLFYERVQP